MIPGSRRLPAWGTALLHRSLDVAAAVLVLAAAWKLFIAPRMLAAASSPAPRMTIAAPGGAYRAGEPAGRVVFLDFWATWCEPCRLSLPLVEQFARAHPEVDVVAVDVNEPSAVAADYARTHGLGRIAFDADGRAAAAYGVEGYPTMVVIDPRGFVRAKWTGFNPAIEAAMAHAAGELGTTARRR